MPHGLKLLYQVWCCVLPIELKVKGSDTTMLNKDKMPASKITNIP